MKSNKRIGREAMT